MLEDFGSSDVGSPVQSCPADKSPPVHWIEIALIGEDDSPIAWEAYQIDLPNGEVVTGFLDEKGFARVDNIEDAGQCKITFPKLDREAWEPA